MEKGKITIIEGIEIGLNIIAQDLVYKSHSDKDIQEYINQFKFERMVKK